MSESREVRFIGGPIDGLTRTVLAATHVRAPAGEDLCETYTYTISRAVSGEWIGADRELETFEGVLPFAGAEEVSDAAREMALVEWRHLAAREGQIVGEPVATLRGGDHSWTDAAGTTLGYDRAWYVHGSVLR